jgi:hypothetical protein
MALFSVRWLTRAWVQKRSRGRGRPTRRLFLEKLEDRMVLSTTLFLVPASVPADSTHFHDLPSAVTAANAGDVIQIEPNSNPTASSLHIDKTLTVQGDPANSPSSLPLVASTSGAFYPILSANGIVLNNLNLGSVLIDDGQTGETISNSLVQSIGQLGGAGADGSNRIFNDTVTGSVSLGNPLGSASGDQVVNNNFINTIASTLLLSVDNDNNALIQGNGFTSSGQLSAIDVADSTSVSILNNTITLTGSSTTGINVVSASRSLSVTISNNRISTNNVGTGIVLERNSSNTFSASVANNNLVLNLVGIAGKGGPLSTDFGAIDAGGGTLGSIGGNDFHGFTGSGGHFAITISLSNGTTADTISALNNSFSVTPSSAVNAAAGKIDVSTSLDANHAFVGAVYDDFLHRSGSPAAGAELDFWAGQLAGLGQGAVAKNIIRSPEGYARLVDSLYVKILGRTPAASEEAGWVGALQSGATMEQLIAGFLASPEYAARANTLAFAPTNSDVNYVQSLYTLLLGRTASATEVAGWLAGLPSLGRSGVAMAFVTSAEFRGDVVQALYTPNTALPSTSFVGIVPELLNRSKLPSASEVSVWVSSGVNLLDIETAVAASAEFFNNG